MFEAYLLRRPTFSLESTFLFNYFRENGVIWFSHLSSGEVCDSFSRSRENFVILALREEDKDSSSLTVKLKRDLRRLLSLLDVLRLRSEKIL